MAHPRRTNGIALDAIDRMLLDALDRNARTPTADLARLIGLSPQSTAERIRRLEDVGVITGFAVKLNPVTLGLAVAAYVRVRPAMGELSRVAEIIASISEVVECDRVTGEDCFIAKVMVPTVTDLERVLDRLLPYAQTNSSIVQSSPVGRRQPRLSLVA